MDAFSRVVLVVLVSNQTLIRTPIPGIPKTIGVEDAEVLQPAAHTSVYVNTRPKNVSSTELLE